MSWSSSAGTRCTPNSAALPDTGTVRRSPAGALRPRARPTSCARASTSPRLGCACATAADAPDRAPVHRGRALPRVGRAVQRRVPLARGCRRCRRGRPRAVPPVEAALLAGCSRATSRHARRPGPPQLRGGRRLGRRAPRARAVARRGQADVLPELQPDAHDEDDDAPLLDLRQVRLALRPPLRVARHVRRRAQLLVVLRPAHARGRHDDAPPRGGRPRRARARARLGDRRARARRTAWGSTDDGGGGAPAPPPRSARAPLVAAAGLVNPRWVMASLSRSTCGLRLTTIASQGALGRRGRERGRQGAARASAGATSRRGRISGGARRRG